MEGKNLEEGEDKETELLDRLFLLYNIASDSLVLL
jgi:hypothetical protein